MTQKPDFWAWVFFIGLLSTSIGFIGVLTYLIPFSSNTPEVMTLDQYAWFFFAGLLLIIFGKHYSKNNIKILQNNRKVKKSD